MSEDLLGGFSKPQVMSVSDLNAMIRLTLEKEFKHLTVEGEIGNFTRASSGHLYFQIKDEKSQVRCVMWRSRANSLRFEPEAGMQVTINGYLSVYEPRGEYQITVSSMEPAGQGALQLAFEKLKEKLAAEGLFDEQHKKPLPFLPRHIGIVTSPTGAAIRDIISVLQRRHPNMRVTIYPSLVQGREAAAQIVRGIKHLDQLESIDAIVVTRGGGSLEDLWPFNEEIVARAIHACGKPVVSAVGHEIDFTIADLVADLRAPTPSAAAEMVIAREDDLRRTITVLRRRMSNALAGRVKQVRTLLAASRPERLAGMVARNIQNRAQAVDLLMNRLVRNMERVIGAKRQAFSRTAASLDALSPLKALHRGYAIATRSGDDDPLNSVSKLKRGDELRLTFSDGSAEARVDTIRKEKDERHE